MISLRVNSVTEIALHPDFESNVMLRLGLVFENLRDNTKNNRFLFRLHNCMMNKTMLKTKRKYGHYLFAILSEDVE